ncbi:MAG: zinc-ribbon domain-containing protein [Porcipelethomonas sp.]
MAFFENLSNKAKTISETTSLNGAIKTEERKIISQYQYIGQLYFEKYGDAPEAEFAEAVAAVKASKEMIKETQQKIDSLNSPNKCPGCGNPFKQGALFCSVCGKSLAAPSPQNTQVCSKCGNVLPAEALFCNSCGNKLNQPAPAPQPVPVTVPEPVPQPVPAPVPEPVPQPVPAPVPEPVPQPVPAPVPEPVPQPVPAPVPEPAPQPVPVPVPEPAPQPAPAPVSEPVAQPEQKADTVCKNCGTKAQDGDLFCDNCGAKLEI